LISDSRAEAERELRGLIRELAQDPSRNGETRNRTGDTAIFRDAQARRKTPEKPRIGGSQVGRASRR